ncbi:50S ribosomal protein L23 [Marinilabiliaceae bacterium ANBcel2]|nr:50S ribosomal protein L23 [Marinilabiliaceae bacterium ANBcel2]
MSIIIKPLVTEKMTEQGETLNQYGFVVRRDANKIEIRKAVEAMYDVQVTSVNTMRYPGKTKSRYTKSGILSGKTSAFKKAIVKLAEGDKIDFYSNI